ncbi:luciferase [Alkalihalobacillus alcalophilus ATCC 27647 = CGMCC 1.3604]|uniref:Luciferase n=1 Tax=Alkalihalobacillus alcalophilus ATCC 27647 = CGMCC 1.3604 TaxID=1218173 RepID=A0A094XCM3_ALKAL|nr:hypothetical protein BALCAV_0215555 [Alkalihalobacillus alcalophilus ATCC 27647 = CGMCC 1.3604]THG91847.1 luciferase [Alkalihalobacillus alcalophilus ATCC 27647 = CGMCC 1.3604]
MKLSILDQMPLAEGRTRSDAYEEAKQLATFADLLGYHRYWVAEHHHLAGLVCPSPEVMLAFLGAHTKNIRLGAGAILLPHYKPYKVAETFHVLATLFPGRIDLGLARSPGGSAEVTNALNDQFLKKVYAYPSLVDQLLQYIQNPKFDSKVIAEPVPTVAPDVWLLGSSEKSAQLAASKGLPYTYGHFRNPNIPMEPLNQYVQQFQNKNEDKKLKSIVALSCICADTTEKARELGLSEAYRSHLASIGKETEYLPAVETVKKEMQADPKLAVQLKGKLEKALIGSPADVKRKLIQLAVSYQIDEFMLLTNVHSFEERRLSYKLIFDEMAK